MVEEVGHVPLSGGIDAKGLVKPAQRDDIGSMTMMPGDEMWEVELK